MNEPVRVLIADDQALVSGSFRLLIDTAPGLITVGEAGTGEEALALARSERPDVVLMDVRMPVMDGIEATRRITAESDLAAVRVLILTTFDHDEYVYAALRAGASGFLLKDTRPVDLLHAITVIAAGDGLLAPSVTRRLIAHYLGNTPVRPIADERLAVLTGRERQVLSLVAQGLSNAEIATALVLSESTVKTHVSRVLAKLGVRDRVQAVILGHECGLADRGA